MLHRARDLPAARSTTSPQTTARTRFARAMAMSIGLRAIKSRRSSRPNAGLGRLRRDGAERGRLCAVKAWKQTQTYTGLISPVMYQEKWGCFQSKIERREGLLQSSLCTTSTAAALGAPRAGPTAHETVAAGPAIASRVADRHLRGVAGALENHPLSPTSKHRPFTAVCIPDHSKETHSKICAAASQHITQSRDAKKGR